MHVSTRSVFLCALFGILFCSPIVVGAFDVSAYVWIATPFSVFAAYAFSTAHNQLSKRITLVLLSSSFGVTVADAAARPLLSYLFEIRPAERFIYRWPMQRQLQRYVPDISFEGVTCGDLAAVSGRTDWREERRMKFVTDHHGFRNDPGANTAARPLDFIAGYTKTRNVDRSQHPGRPLVPCANSRDNRSGVCA